MLANFHFHTTQLLKLSSITQLLKKLVTYGHIVADFYQIALKFKDVDRYRKVYISIAVLLFGLISVKVLGRPAELRHVVDSSYVDAQINIAKGNVEQGALSAAGSVCQRLLDDCSSVKFHYGILKSLVGLGNIAVHKGEFGKALEIYNRALKSNAFSNAKDVQPTVYANIGNICALRGDHAGSAKFYELAIETAHQTGSTVYTPLLYANLSVAYHVLKKYDKAIMILNKAERMALSANNYLLLAEIFTFKGLSYTELNDYSKSDHYFEQAVNIAQKRGFTHLLFSAYTSQGNAYLARNNVSEALKSFRRAELAGADITGFRRNTMMIGLAKALIRLENYKEAGPLLQTILTQAQAIENIKDQITAHALLVEVYQYSDKFDSAFYHRTFEMQLTDSFKKNEMTLALAEIENEHNAALKGAKLTESQLTIAQQQVALGRRNNWIFMILFVAGLLAVFIFYQRRAFLQKQRIKGQEMKEVLQQQKILEMKALLEGEEKERVRLSQEIHDNIMVQFSVIKMGLSTWLGQSGAERKIEDIASTMTQLDNATENLRRTAHNLMPDVLWEEGLVDALYFFCDNLQKAVPVRFDFQPLGIIPRFEPGFELSVYRIIQELLQNVIKHAQAKEVLVQLSYDETMFGITVEDDGVGMRQDEFSSGMGLKSIANRVSSFAGTMEVDSKEGVGTSIHLQFDKLSILAAG